MSTEARTCTARHLVVALALVGAFGCQQGGAAAAGAGMTSDNVIPTGQACTPTGKHFEHRSFQCTACHLAAGALCFDPALAGTSATFDATTKNCSSIACHGTVAGTFTYNGMDGAGDTISITVPYGGAGGAAANWYAAPGNGCNGCHGYPPTYNGVPYAWHSGTHGQNISNGNACQLCHPDATGAYVYGGPPSFTGTSAGLVTTCAPGTFCSAPGTITVPSMHRDGVLNVSPQWRSACIGCH